MKNIFKYSRAVLVATFCLSFANAQQKKADKQTDQWRYEVELLGQKSGRGGHGLSYTLRVWSYSKDKFIAEEQGKKNAIHAIVFKGIPANEELRLNGLDPMAGPGAEDINAAFFNKFFDQGGDYMRYVTVTSAIEGAVKFGKEYKVPLVVSVDVPGLRKHLEEFNIITALKSGFDKAKKPSLMVVPSRSWCVQNGCMDEFETMGEKILVPNYQKAFDMNPQLNLVTSKIGQFMSDEGFDLRLMSRVLTTIQNEAAEQQVLTSSNGSMVAESPIDKMRRVANADIWLEVDWMLNENGLEKSVTINLSGIDAYTDEQIANGQGTGKPTTSNEIQVLVGAAINNNMGTFISQLHSKFDEWFEQGRQITVQIQKWDGWEYNLESEFDGDELGILIEDYIAETTVNNQFSTDMATENRMIFSNVRIPMINEETGRAMDARRYGISIQKMLRDRYQITAKVMTKGLGQVTIILGEK